MVDLYIYYAVRDADAPQLEPRVRAMQAHLAGQLGIVCQLKRRPEPKDGLQTWMEIYLGTEASFDAALDTAVQDAGLSELIDGKRHTEVFMDVTTCA